LLALITILLSACDIDDTQHEQKTVGPSITILGTNIEGASAQIPSDGVIQIAFDRYLLPSTITRQSYLVLDGNRQPLATAALRTIYDPVARTVTITGPDGPGKAWLTPDQTYHLILPVAAGEDDVGGFRAIDRAKLTIPKDYTFRAGQPAGVTEIDPPVDFCGTVLPLLTMKCSGSECHGVQGGGTRTASSLILNTSEGVRVTAINRVAQAANTSARSYSPEPAGRLFGVNMALILPNDPGQSWLMYKLELAAHPKVDAGAKPNFICTPPNNVASNDAGASDGGVSSARFAPFALGARVEADEIERAILNDFILGREMPYPAPPAELIPIPTTANPNPSNYSRTPLTFEEREQIRIWIARGAQTTECGGCGEFAPSTIDAGPTPEAGATGPDAGGDAGPVDAGDGG
jgi:hypothetical protein